MKTPKNLRVHSSNEVTDYESRYRKWKIKLTMLIFFSSKQSDETRNMHVKCDNIEIMMGSETDDIIDELCESLLQKISRRVRRNNERRRVYF